MKQLMILAVTVLALSGPGAAGATPPDPRAQALRDRLVNLDNWVDLTAATDGLYFIQAPRGVADIKAGSFWMRTEYFDQVPSVNGPYRSSLALVETRCGTYEYRITEITLYRLQDMTDGRRDASPYATWAHAPPGSIVEHAMQIVCDALASVAH